MTAPAPRAALYYRTSVESEDPGRQVDDLVALAASRGWDVASRFGDRAVSGASADRPGLAALLQAARGRAVDVVAVTELSRLTRRGILDLFTILRDLEAAGVELVSIAEPWITTAGPLREPLLAFAAWAADQERRLLVERTKSGVARARAAGKRIGRHPVLTPELLAEIIRLRDGEHLRWSQIAVRVHHPATSCRKWYSTSRVAKPRVINGGTEIRSPSDTSRRTPPA